MLNRLSKVKAATLPNAKTLLSKVPEVTVYFWLIKVLCTTIGETAADYLNVTMNFGLIRTSIVASLILIVLLFFQLNAKRYIASLYWSVVVVISVVGTLITDNLTDNLNVPLELTAPIFAGVLAIVFTLWFRSEKTLSIHSITTMKREVFYWLAILFTFALGTAAGDLVAEKLSLGYVVALALFAVAIAVTASLYRIFKLNAVVAFWIAYILTRPLGASIGDYLSQAKADGGLGLGTTVTSYIFLALILLTVTYLSVTKRDTAKG